MTPDDHVPTPTVAGPATPSPETEPPSPAEATDPRAEPPGGRNLTKSIVEWALVIGGALLVAFLIKTFLFQAFYIPSESMEPTLIRNDRVIVNKLSYSLHDVNRGDVIVFDRPPNEPASEIDELIKRVIGLGGETIEGRDGAIYIDGRRLVEPYLPAGSDAGTFAPVQIPDGHVFTMGDNRGNSRDSRFYGPIDEDLIVGRAFVRVWPVGRLGFL